MAPNLIIILTLGPMLFYLATISINYISAVFLVGVPVFCCLAATLYDPDPDPAPRPRVVYVAEREQRRRRRLVEAQMGGMREGALDRLVWGLYGVGYENRPYFA
jgi:hypothetical protein